jgi:hypothetical protein
MIVIGLPNGWRLSPVRYPVTILAGNLQSRIWASTQPSYTTGIHFYSSREYPAACGGDESGCFAFELQDTARLAARRFIQTNRGKVNRKKCGVIPCVSVGIKYYPAFAG